MPKVVLEIFPVLLIIHVFLTTTTVCLNAGDTISGVELPDFIPSTTSPDSSEGSSTLMPSNGLVNACLLRCKDAHMMKMDNEWSMDFAFPLLSLLRTNGSVEAATEKARNICDDNEMLDSCFKSCGPTLERKILRLGLQPWKHICQRFDVLITQLDCWKLNIDTLTLGCHLESHKLRQSMEHLTHNQSVIIVDEICKDMNVLSICSIEEYSKYCGDVTKLLLVRLFRSSRDSIVEMLKIKWPVLPDTCSQKIEYYKNEEAQLALSKSNFLNVFSFGLVFLLLKLSV